MREKNNDEIKVTVIAKKENMLGPNKEPVYSVEVEYACDVWIAC